MALRIGILILAMLLVFLGYVGLQPEEYKIARQLSIHAPAEKIFPYLNNSKLAELWGPWKETDPRATMEFSGPDEGVGSRTSWRSEGQLGTGSATIVESVPNQRVEIKLEYVKPMKMTQDSEYSISPQGDQSLVTWRVTGKNTFMGRLMCVFINMDKMVGGMFEKGLSNLKALAEKPG